MTARRIIPEKYWQTSITLQISNKVRSELENKGVNVVMTRESDIHLNGDLSTDLARRAQIAENNNADFLISIHADSGSPNCPFEGPRMYLPCECKGGVSGELDRCDINECAVTQAQFQKSLAIGNNVMTDVKSEFGNLPVVQVDPNLKGLDATAILSANDKVPAALIETGFMCNPTDLARLQSSAHQERLAKVIANSLVEQLT